MKWFAEMIAEVLKLLWSSLQVLPRLLKLPLQLAFFKPSAAAIRKHVYIASNDEGGTFRYDERLPSLPLPDLMDTLKLYKDSCRPHLTESEIKDLEVTLSNFEKSVGAELHAKLAERAKVSRNWVEKWWEEEVYLKSRLPLVPYNSMVQVEPFPAFVTEDFDFSEAVIYLHYSLEFWLLLHQEKIKPQVILQKNVRGVLAGGDGRHNTTWTMHQFRNFFSHARIPKEGMDELSPHFRTTREARPTDCPNDILVLYRGFTYFVEVADLTTEGLSIQERLMTPDDLKTALQWIVNDARSRDPSLGHGVPALSCDDRDQWARNRDRLMALDPKNTDIMRRADRAIMGITLSDEMPGSESEVMKSLMIPGDGAKNLWADKSFTFKLHRNGARGGSADHTPFDGMTNAFIRYYTILSFEMCGGKWTNSIKGPSRRSWPEPERMDFVVDEELEKEIERVCLESKQMGPGLNILVTRFLDFGKGVLKLYRAHPDAFFQAAIQVAYYRNHKKPGSTYETAATRKFYHGRTETCRTCSPEVVDFAKALNDPSIQENEKRSLLKVALEKHQSLMKAAQENRGCDRHMFGLQMIALEQGINDPLIKDVFCSDPWTKSGGSGNFVLSTSLLGYASLLGATVPMCANGYGVFYSIQEDSMEIILSNWAGNGTDSQQLSDSICSVLREMEALMNKGGRSSEK